MASSNASPKKTLALWLVLVVMFVAIYQLLGSKSSEELVEFSSAIDMIDADGVQLASFAVGPSTCEIILELEGGRRVRTTGVFSDELVRHLNDHGVPFRVTRHDDAWGPVMTLVPMAFVALVFFLFMRQLSKGPKTDTLKKAPIERLHEQTPKLMFADVAGVRRAKAELAELAEALRTPERLGRAGAGLPKGVLIEGPPGTGKSRLARAFANELGRPVLAVPGSGFVDMFVGTGASRVRDLFDTAKKEAPCVILIDDFDAFARKRGDASGFQGGEREHALQQLLTCLDGSDAASNQVLLVATTNRPDLIDPAALRSGHVDRRVHVELPELSERTELVRHFAKRDAIDADALATKTDGASGADLETILNDARLRASTRGGAIDAGVLEAAVQSWRTARG
ncbi:MAG: AAA family ATPase [Deltaproteobacteria bacterium]|nr:AAA family ATPase [Deltaproteobacteria bacterium]